MKRSDSGDFYMLYIEPEDERAEVFDVFAAISREARPTKPIVVLLPVAGKTRAFARPEDFSDLKHIKRQYGLLILFVISTNEHLRQLATRCGFHAYISIDALSDALFQGQISFTHQRTLAKMAPAQAPISPGQLERRTSVRKTVPLSPPTSFQQSTQAVQPERSKSQLPMLARPYRPPADAPGTLTARPATKKRGS